MAQDPKHQNTCDVCRRSFSSGQELETHNNADHGLNSFNESERQSNYDIERD